MRRVDARRLFRVVDGRADRRALLAPLMLLSSVVVSRRVLRALDPSRVVGILFQCLLFFFFEVRVIAAEHFPKRVKLHLGGARCR